MNYLLHNPYLLSLAPLIAVPLLVHLLTRARPPKYLFSATSFVMKVVQQTLRVKRPKDRLLLLCRTLLFLALCLVFLRPVVFLEDRIAGFDGPRSVVFVIDRSASMAWSEGGRTRFTAACDEAAAMLTRLSSRDKANIIWIDGEPDAVFPEMGSNIEYLREHLKNARGSNEHGNAETAVQLALAQLKAGEGARELCIVSDFQASQWKHVELTVPDDIAVSTLTPAREAAHNGAVLSITTDPVAPLAGDTAQVMLSVGNFSSTPRNRSIIVKLDEHIVTRQVQVPAWGHAAVALEHVFPNPGPTIVSARLDEDSFGVDDWRAISVPVRHALRVGVAGEDPMTAPIFRRALASLPWVEARQIDVLNIEASRELDLVMLPGWKGENLNALAQLNQLGVAFIVVPAPGLPMAVLSELLGRQPPETADAFQCQFLDQAMGLVLADSGHKAFTLFRDGQFGDPSRAAFTRRLVATQMPDKGSVLMSFTDSRPAVIEYSAGAPVVVWLAPLSAEYSTWTTRPAFLPFFGELLEAVGGRRQVALPASALPGETLSFESGAFADNRQLVDKAGKAFPVVRIDSTETGTRYVSDPIEAPGIYRLCAGQACSPAQLVNFPGAESDLRTGPPPGITKESLNAAGSADELNARRNGASLWKFFIWAALGLIAIECVLVLLLDREENKMAQGSI